MTIEEIFHFEYISVRAFNVCKGNDLKDLTAILKYYHEFNTFSKLRHCGRKSDQELINLCLKYIDHDDYQSIELSNQEKQLTDVINAFTRIQREVINSFIEINTSNLSNRSKNAIVSFLNGNLKIRNISEKILANKRFNFQDIKNVGRKSITELKSYFESILDFVFKVRELDDEMELIALRNRFFIEKTFSIFSIPDKILKSQSVFEIVNFLICEGVIFEKNENIIFQRALKIYNNQHELAIDEIAREINLSRERIRQIKNNVIENLYIKLQFVKNIEDDLYQKYGIDQNQHLIRIDNDINKKINEVNDTNFTIEFNSFIVYSFISNQFELVGIIEDVIQPKSYITKGRHKWDNFYLVSKKLASKFDFNSFVDDVDRRINARNEITYGFHFKSYLTNFIRYEDSSLLSELSTVAEKIINQEFELIIDLNDDIVFRRNTIKPVTECAIEVLEELGVPSNIEDIYKHIELNYPEITKNQNALRGSLQRTPEIIYFGRSSTYGLKKWETEKEGIKGGTIKDIVLEYLEDKNDPIHILELEKEVHKYRKETNAKSIMANLKLDSHNQFIIFNQSFVGLSSRSYDSKLTNLPKFLGKTITYFVKQNGRINRSSVEIFFSGRLGISPENARYIVEHLIENQFIQIDNQNNLII